MVQSLLRLLSHGPVQWLGDLAVASLKWAELAVTVAVLIAISSGEDPYAERQVRAVFDIAPAVPLSQEAFGAAVEAAVPLGTPREAVLRLLAERGVGSDECSSFSAGQGTDLITCRIWDGPEVRPIMQMTYFIVFTFDANGALDKIKAQAWASSS